VPLVPGPPGVLLQIHSAVSTPIFDTEAGAQISVLVQDYARSNEHPETIQIPKPSPNVVIPSFPFGWAVLLNSTHEVDLSQVTTYIVQNYSQGGGFGGEIEWVAGTQTFALSGDGAGVVPGLTVTGVPLLGGAFLPEDVERGFIDHVLAVSWPQFRDQQQYWEATTEVSSDDFYGPCGGGVYGGSSWRQYALGACQVLRLNPEGTLVTEENNLIDESAFAPITRLVLRGMRTYGVMPVRTGVSMSIVHESEHVVVRLFFFLQMQVPRRGFSASRLRRRRSWPATSRC
jgi:hypothetical protein